MKITRYPNGTAREQVELDEIQVPDLWHLAQDLRAKGLVALSNQVLDVWGLAHDLLWNLRELDKAHEDARLDSPRYEE